MENTTTQLNIDDIHLRIEHRINRLAQLEKIEAPKSIINTEKRLVRKALFMMCHHALKLWFRYL